MNRRSFISSILTLCAAPTILPAALTYRRVWVPEPQRIVLPYYGYDIGAGSLTQARIVWIPPDRFAALFIPTEYHGKAVLI